MLKRSLRNPILMARADLGWCSKKVYNCAVYKDRRGYLMLFRAIGDDWTSRLGLAKSPNGTTFKMDPMPALSPLMPWESHGCEDPRMVKINSTYYVTYTAFDGTTARAAITSSTDLHTWDERRLLFPRWDQKQIENHATDWSKAAALFPKKIGDLYYLFFGDNHIWAATSPDLVHWRPVDEPVLSAREGFFDAAYVEMGPPPIRTSSGWLVLYHGIDRLDNQRTYSLGAALFDLENPLKIIWRSNTPILVPTESYETLGMIDIIEGGFDTLKTLGPADLQKLADERQLPKAIFCCGAVLENSNLRIYYSGGDTVICTAKIDLESIFEP